MDLILLKYSFASQIYYSTESKHGTLDNQTSIGAQH